MLKVSRTGPTTNKQSEPDFSRTCSFCKVLEHVELSPNKTIQEIQTNRSRDMDRNLKDASKNAVNPFVILMIFFKDCAVSLLYPYSDLTLC